MISSKIFKAGPGDSILIKFKGLDNCNHNLLIDGGTRIDFFRYLKVELDEIIRQGEMLDLVIVTHRDDDHILGILTLMNDEKYRSLIKKIWFNSNKIIGKLPDDRAEISDEVPMVDTPGSNGLLSADRAYSLESLLESESTIEWNSKPILAPDMLDLCGLKIQVLSPELQHLRRIYEPEDSDLAGCLNDYSYNIENLVANTQQTDNSLSNKTSIAVLLEYSGKKYLLLGDAVSETICKSLRQLGYSSTNRILVEYVKLSHHASKKSLSDEFLDLITCTDFIISTSGSKYCLPNKEALARILYHPNRSKDDLIKFYFNYNISSNIFSQVEMKNYNFICLEPSSSQTGIEI